MLILKVVSLEPTHGWNICERIQQISDEALHVNHGSLYPALHRLTRKGWLHADWRQTENNRRARYYRLTAAGKRQLGVEQEQWTRLMTGINQILGTA